MDPTVATALLSGLVALITALGVFLARTKFSTIMRSSSMREETAVTQMAAVLDKLAEFQREREIRLMDIQEKALDTVAAMTSAVQAVTLSIQAHDAASDNLSGKLSHGQRAILSAMNDINRQMSQYSKDLDTRRTEQQKERQEDLEHRREEREEDLAERREE